MVNAITGSNTLLLKQIYEFDGGKIVGILVKSLKFTDIRLVKNVLEAIDELLKLD